MQKSLEITTTFPLKKTFLWPYFWEIVGKLWMWGLIMFELGDILSGRLGISRTAIDSEKGERWQWLMLVNTFSCSGFQTSKAQLPANMEFKKYLTFCRNKPVHCNVILTTQLYKCSVDWLSCYILYTAPFFLDFTDLQSGKMSRGTALGHLTLCNFVKSKKRG